MIASVAVGTTETQVLSPPPGAAYKFVAIANVGEETVYLKLAPGSDALTSSNGVPLPSGASILCDQDSQRELFDAGASAIVASGSGTVAVQAY